MNTINNLATKVEIFNIRQEGLCLGYLNIDRNTSFFSFDEQVTKLTEIKQNTRIQLIINGKVIIESNLENFEFIKKRILNMKRMTTVCFIIEDLSDIDKRLDSFETIEDIHDDFGKLDYLDFDLSTLSEKAYPSASINDISRQINQAVSIFLQNKPSGTTQEQQVISC